MIKPFIRWAGGKQNIVNHLLSHLPKDIDKVNYYEPFLGAGSLFWAIEPKAAFLSDINNHLINSYKAIKIDYVKLFKHLEFHKKNNTDEYYYNIRNQFNKENNKLNTLQASRFIYLIQTCFNGIYRVNKNGEYNVPYGYRKNINIPNIEELRQINVKLNNNVKLKTGSYKNILQYLRKGDFVYLDPPYPPLNNTSCFVHYTPERYSLNDHEELFEFCKILDENKINFMMSNADTKFIKSLYNIWNINKIEVRRYISCKKEKRGVGELIIKNY